MRGRRFAYACRVAGRAMKQQIQAYWHKFLAVFRGGSFLTRLISPFRAARTASEASPADDRPTVIAQPTVVRQYEEHPSESYMELKYRFRDIGRLKAIAETLGRDFLTAMPDGAWKSRLGQIAYIHRLVHERLTGPDMVRFIDEARNHEARNPGDWDIWDSANLHQMRVMQQLQGPLGADIIERRARLEYEGRRRHRDALAQSDWPGAREFLAGTVDLHRQIAELRASANGRDSLYQALVDEYMPGIAVGDIDGWFGTLKDRLGDMLPKVIEKQARATAPQEIGDFYPAKAQMWLNTALLKAIGFDFERGGLYETGHNPVEGGTPEDTRLVIKNVDIRNFLDSMKSTLHEGGHGLYIQGLPRRTWRYQPVGQDMGAAVQESQALLVEMVIGRTPEFFRFLSPRVEGLFHGLNNPVLKAENLHALKTRVRPSPVRKTADELTYFFHVAHRFRLEKDLIDGKLQVADLPDAWNAQMQDMIGIRPTSMRDGCLQDVHWFVGKFGYFPSYTIGHMLAAQQFEAMNREIPDLSARIADGRFGRITEWLNNSIHANGRVMNFDALVGKATGAKLDTGPLLRHIERRYLKAA